MYNNWLDSIYSDTSEAFVSDNTPDIGDIIDVTIRMYKDAPVKRVLVRAVPNGAENYYKAAITKEEKGLVYYTAKLPINEYRVQYQFDIVTDTNIYFYTQMGITTYIPDQTYDFIILSDYRQPDWVKGAVFYQIFPERFCNGNPKINVRSGEYEYRGNKSIEMESWYDRPLSWEEGHSLDFFGGDLEGVTKKLDYLEELGVTALYLNPIFSAYSNHKYDCIDYFHVDEHFGGDEALERLCKEVHKRGMKIILDISINHTGIENIWVKKGKPFYFKNADGSLKGWFGIDTLPILDYRNGELRRLVYKDEDSALKKWLKEPYCIDGWRFDVADVFARNDRVQLADEVWQEVCDAIREVNPDAFIIGEDWGDCAKFLQGHLWNTPMNYFGFGRIIRHFVGLSDLFLERHEEFADVKYKLTAKDVAARYNEHYAKIPGVIADCQMNLFDSHDIARLHNYDEISFDRWKIAVTAQLLWTGIPCIYYGDEVAIDGYTDHDSGFRYPMPWDRITDEGKRHLNTIHIMTGLRKNYDAFSRGGRKVIYDDGYIIAIARFFKDEVFLGVLSMEEEDKEITLPLKLVGASAPEGERDMFGISIKGRAAENGDYILSVPAEGSLLMKCL